MSWGLAEWANMDIGTLWINSIIFSVNSSHYCLFWYDRFVSDILDLPWGCFSRSMLISLSLHFKLSTRNCLVFYIFKNKENPSIWLFYSDALQRFSCTLLSHRFTSPQSQLQRLLDMHDKLPCLSRFFCWISLNLPIVFNNFNSYSFTTNFFWSSIDSDFHGLC